MSACSENGFGDLDGSETKREFEVGGEEFRNTMRPETIVWGPWNPEGPQARPEIWAPGESKIVLHILQCVQHFRNVLLARSESARGCRRKLQETVSAT